MDLHDGVALVTGAGSGIGRALATTLSGRGARLILAGRRIEQLEETRAGLTVPTRAVIVAADVTDPVDRARLVAAAEAAGSLHLLVNNAGMVAVGPAETANDELVARLVAINLQAPIALSCALLPLLRRSRPSRVLNIGSMFGDIAYPLFAAYSATKFGLRGWSDAVRREWADDGVGVTYAAPRATRTDAASEFAHLAQPMAMAFDTAERVAETIVAAIERDARTIYPRMQERLAVTAQHFAPSLIDRVTRSQLRAARRAAGGPAPAGA